MECCRPVIKYSDNPTDMQFDITLKIDEPARPRQPLIESIKRELQDFFKDRDYGKDILQYNLLIICVGKNFDHLFPVNKPTYVDHKVSKNRFTGESIEMNKLFINEVKMSSPEYEEFLHSGEEDVRKLLARKIVGSLDNLESLPKKVKDFDKQRFKTEMQHFLIGRS